MDDDLDGLSREELIGEVGRLRAVFAILRRDGLPIMLRLVPPHERISPNGKQGFGQTL